MRLEGTSGDLWSNSGQGQLESLAQHLVQFSYDKKMNEKS